MLKIITIILALVANLTIIIANINILYLCFFVGLCALPRFSVINNVWAYSISVQILNLLLVKNSATFSNNDNLFFKKIFNFIFASWSVALLSSAVVVGTYCCRNGRIDEFFWFFCNSYLFQLSIFIFFVYTFRQNYCRRIKGRPARRIMLADKKQLILILTFIIFLLLSNYYIWKGNITFYTYFVNFYANYGVAIHDWNGGTEALHYFWKIGIIFQFLTFIILKLYSQIYNIKRMGLCLFEILLSLWRLELCFYCVFCILDLALTSWKGTDVIPDFWLQICIFFATSTIIRYYYLRTSATMFYY